MRRSAISALVFLTVLSLFAEQSPSFRTSADVREGVRGNVIGTVTTVRETRNEFVVAPDDDRYGTIDVAGDSVSTVYSGFGGVINGAPEVFTGSAGLTNVRVGDRVDVRGVGRANAILNAEQVILLGRSVAADQVGVGQTRTPTSPSTPTASSATPNSATSDRIGRVDGVVRQVSAAEHRITIETDRNELITIRGSASTPVYYHNDVYHIQDLDVGDRVRIEPQSSTSTGNITARTIDVIKSVQENGSTTPTRSVGQLAGRVTRVDRPNDMVQIAPDGGRDAEIRVDLIGAYDPAGRRVRAADVQAGDRLDLSGTYNGDVFVASTVRVTEPPAPASETKTTRVLPGELGLVTVYASVVESLATSPQLVVRDTVANRTIRVYVADDLIVRTRAGTYATADKLKNGDSIVLKGFRDADGNYIAQTIRVR
jgi:hypothetical protein